MIKSPKLDNMNVPPMPPVKPSALETKEIIFAGNDKDGKVISETVICDGINPIALKNIITSLENCVRIEKGVSSDGSIYYKTDHDSDEKQVDLKPKIKPGVYHVTGKGHDKIKYVLFATGEGDSVAFSVVDTFTWVQHLSVNPDDYIFGEEIKRGGTDYVAQSEFLSKLEELYRKYYLATYAYYKLVFPTIIERERELSNLRRSITDDVVNLMYDYFPRPKVEES